MNIQQALILSFVEGITEFLPISSTGHMTLVSYLFGLSNIEFVKSFEIIIQLGAIFAVFMLYAKRFLLDKHLWKLLLSAFIPTTIIGLGLYSLVKHVLLGNPYIVVISLFLGGIVLLFIDKVHIHTTFLLNKLPLRRAGVIGVIQTLSMIPGVSRSAATIIGGQLMGLSRKEAVEFSFFLAVPTMVAATALDIVKSSFAFSQQEYLLLFIGLIGAFITALVAIKTFVSFVQNRSFAVFGVYRIILSLCYYFFFLKP
jgi:undecaprenyl-diphosphatase